MRIQTRWVGCQVIFTNESNIDRFHNARQKAVDSKIGRLQGLAAAVGVPIQVSDCSRIPNLHPIAPARPILILILILCTRDRCLSRVASQAQVTPGENLRLACGISWRDS